MYVGVLRQFRLPAWVQADVLYGALQSASGQEVEQRKGEHRLQPSDAGVHLREKSAERVTALLVVGHLENTPTPQGKWQNRIRHDNLGIAAPV
jgi:hypothetical protein